MFSLVKDIPILFKKKHKQSNSFEDNSISLKIEALYFVDVFQEAVLVIDSKDNSKPELTLDEELLLSEA